jgi:hypothetical protein
MLRQHRGMRSCLGKQAYAKSWTTMNLRFFRYELAAGLG